MIGIYEFQGESRWLSNFWPCKVNLDGYEYNSVEHAYVASKTDDESIRQSIRLTESAGHVKRIGRSLTLSEGWESKRLEIMENLLRQKFAYGTELGNKLLRTKGIIVEGNSWGDTFWGVCRGNGMNHLGRILMRIRDDLISIHETVEPPK